MKQKDFEMKREDFFKSMKIKRNYFSNTPTAHDPDPLYAKADKFIADVLPKVFEASPVTFHLGFMTEESRYAEKTILNLDTPVAMMNGDACLLSVPEIDELEENRGVRYLIEVNKIKKLFKSSELIVKAVERFPNQWFIYLEIPQGE